MSCRVAVVGSSGRVGRAIAEHLAGRYEVCPVKRVSGESPEALARRALADADLVINAAGVAHLERPSSDDVRRLQVANVELPLAIARAALQHSASMIHISSVKAAEDPPATPYARSKRDADERLQAELVGDFESAGSSLVVIRPLALLLPPFDAGRVSKLRFLRWWPGPLTPPIRLPVLATGVFLDAIDDAVECTCSGASQPAWRLREFSPSERGSLRDVRAAMLSEGGARR